MPDFHTNYHKYTSLKLTLFCSAVIVVASKTNSNDYNTDRNLFSELERWRNRCNHIEYTVYLPDCMCDISDRKYKKYYTDTRRNTL